MSIPTLGRMTFIERLTIVVHDYDEAIAFFVGVLGFVLVEDAPAVSDAGRPKRWVVVRPPGGETAVVLAQADGAAQAAVVGNQAGGRVAFFLRVEDFDAAHGRIAGAGVEITPARDEPYGRVAIFRDVAGNRWDLIGPAPARDGSPSAQAGRSE